MTKTDFLSAWVFEAGFPLTREVRHAVDDLFYSEGDLRSFNEIDGKILIFPDLVAISNSKITFSMARTSNRFFKEKSYLGSGAEVSATKIISP